MKVTGFNNATSPVYVWGYDRKFYFDEKSAPLFMVQERDVNRFLNISLKAFPLYRYWFICPSKILTEMASLL